MVRTPVLFDTNILIDYLRGIDQAHIESERYANRAISIISWIEVMAGVTAESESLTRITLANFYTLPITLPIAEEAAVIRRQERIQLPDAIILATARITERTLITRNTRDFPPGSPGVRIPYVL